MTPSDPTSPAPGRVECPTEPPVAPSPLRETVAARLLRAWRDGLDESDPDTDPPLGAWLRVADLALSLPAPPIASPALTVGDAAERIAELEESLAFARGQVERLCAFCDKETGFAVVGYHARVPCCAGYGECYEKACGITGAIDAARHSTSPRPATLTVGAELTGHVVEYHTGVEWRQANNAGNRRAWVAGRWSEWSGLFVPRADHVYPCRRIPIASADLPPDSRGPLASPRPAEAEREVRCALTCPHGDRCTLATHDAATGCNHRVCPCNEPNEPGLWVTRAMVREAMHVGVALTDESDADHLWAVLAAGDDLEKLRGMIDAIRKPDPASLHARVESLLARLDSDRIEDEDAMVDAPGLLREAMAVIDGLRADALVALDGHYANLMRRK